MSPAEAEEDSARGSRLAAVVPDRAFLDFVRAKLPVEVVPAVPEIRLHQAGPHSGIRRWAQRVGYAAPPYWARPWSGGLVLARFLLDGPARVAGRRVLDLGTGSGLAAIAAGRAGAAHVMAVDVDPYAVAAAGLNARLNGVAIEAQVGDLTREPPPCCDIVLCGDLFYEAQVSRRIAGFLARCVGAGLEVLVGDPGRAHLPLGSLEPLFSRAVPDFGSAGASSLSTVYGFRAS